MTVSTSHSHKQGVFEWEWGGQHGQEGKKKKMTNCECIYCWTQELLAIVVPHETHLTFYLSVHADCTEVWPSEGRGAEDLDRGYHRYLHRAWLPERPEEWSHPVRVSRAIRCYTSPAAWWPGSFVSVCTKCFGKPKCFFLFSAFVSVSSTNCNLAQWKRSTSQRWTGIRWVGR